MILPPFLRRREIANLQDLARRNYFAYLRTDWWQARRKRVYAKANHRCELCHKQGVKLEAHHTTYERVGCERDSDMIALCDPCHEKVHYNGRGKWSRSQLLRYRRKIIHER